MIETPDYLQDASDLLGENGFETGSVWYHGTSSALLGSIKGSGLRRSGDSAMNLAAKSTMATIGNEYEQSQEPVFLTQSKELAYYWATQAVRRRSVRIEGEEKPVVLEVKLPATLLNKVKPDVGAAGLLMLKEGEHFIATLAKIYEDSGQGVLDIDLMKADRNDYLNKLGMAYIDADIPPGHVSLLQG